MKTSFLKRSFLSLFQQNRTSLYLVVFFGLISSYSCLGMNKRIEKRNYDDCSSSFSSTSNEKRIKVDGTFEDSSERDSEDVEVTTLIVPEELPPRLTPVPLFLAQLRNALDQNNIFAITKSFDDLIKHIPQILQLPNHNEGFYHSLIHTLLRLTNYNVCSDIPTGSGEADTCIRTADNIYLFEFKINTLKKENSQQETILGGLKQIFENDYYKQNHQDDVPMTLAGISFYGNSKDKKIRDNFTHLSCASLELKKAPKTLRAYPFAQPTESMSDHNEAPNFCSLENWNQLHVQKNDSMDEAEEVIDESYSQINTYHPNLRNIQKGLIEYDVPLVVKNIECILHAIPWSLRKFNREYFQAIIYTSLLCSGINITAHENTIQFEAGNYKYKFICSFSNDSDIESIQTKLKKNLKTLSKEYTSIKKDDLEGKPETLIILNINQPPQDGSNASKIQLISEGIIVKNKVIYQLDGETKIKNLKKTLTSSIIITSPRTIKKSAKRTTYKDDLPSPYQSPRTKTILKKTIQEDDPY